MRLVDADELKKSGYRLVHIDNLKPKQSCKSWAEVPTAYDVEKVVEQIYDEIFVYDIPKDIVTEIVRKGGGVDGRVN